MCEESSLECCRVKWEGREFSFISSIAVSLRHMICCNPADVREGFASPLCLLLLSWLLLSVGSGSKCNQPPLLVLLQGASCLQGSLCQRFVARKAAAAERNPPLQGSALHSPHCIYSHCKHYHLFPLESLLLFHYLLFAAGLEMVWEGSFEGAEWGIVAEGGEAEPSVLGLSLRSVNCGKKDSRLETAADETAVLS